MNHRWDRLRGVLVDVAPLRLDRDYRWLWIGQIISGTGNQISRIALPFQVYVLTGSTLAIAVLTAVQLVPILVFSLGAGSLADALDRRRLLAVTQVGMALSSLALAGLALTPDPPLIAILALAFVAASVGSIDQPARASATPRLVPTERLPAAIALNQVNFQVQSIVGPAIGGLLLATVGVAGAYLVDAFSFIGSLVALSRIRPLSPLGAVTRPGLDAVREGLAFARRHRVIMSTFVIDLNAMILGMPMALFPVLALDVFRVGPAGVGLMASALAAGAFVVAVLSGWLGGIRYAGRAVVRCVVVWGLAIAGFGIVTFSFPMALALLALAGAADVVSAVLRSTIVQLETPDELRGRVTALHILAVTSGPRVGDIEAAALAAVVGVQASVVSGGVLSALGALVVARRYPELQRHESPRPAPSPVAEPA